MKCITPGKIVGISIFTFGLGILVSFFLPDKVLAVIEALLIVAIGLLFFLGIRMIKESFSDEEDHHFDPTRLATVLMLAVATSIDALAVGISFAFVGMNSWQSVGMPIFVIGIVSFMFSVIGCLVGVYFGKRVNIKAELWAGIILIGIGAKILIEHLEIL